MADDRKDPRNQARAGDREIRQEHQDEQASPEFQKSSAGLAAPTTGGQSAGSVGTVGAESADNEYGAQGTSSSPAKSASGSVVGAGAGQAGIARGGGFIGSQGDERDPQQAGFAEQGRGAPEEGRDIERGGERSANRDSDIEGSSEDR